MHEEIKFQVGDLIKSIHAFSVLDRRRSFTYTKGTLGIVISSSTGHLVRMLIDNKEVITYGAYFRKVNHNA